VDAGTRTNRQRRAAVLTIAGLVVVLLAATAIVFGGGVVPSHWPSGIRYTTTITFDGDGLVLAPPPAAAPALSEADAIALFRSSSMPTTYVSNVSVGYATATVRPDISSGDGLAVPRFDHTPAWVIVDRPGPFHCPMTTGPPAMPGSGPLAGDEVYLLDAATGRLGVDYQPRGFGCSQASGPFVHPAKSYLSLPWTLVGAQDLEATVSVTAGGCAPVAGSGSGGTNRTDLAVFAVRTLMPMTCPAPVTQQLQVPAAVQTTPVHAPTGLVVGIETPDDGFIYQEGAP
jgi:hypothetical protein